MYCWKWLDPYLIGVKKAFNGPNGRFLKENEGKTVKIGGNPRKSLQDTGTDSLERFTDIIGSPDGFLNIFPIKSLIFALWEAFLAPIEQKWVIL